MRKSLAPGELWAGTLALAVAVLIWPVIAWTHVEAGQAGGLYLLWSAIW